MVTLGAKGSDGREFLVRVMMALVLAPIGVGSVLAGGYLLMAVLALLLVVASYEWTRMTVPAADLPRKLYLATIVVAGLAALVAASFSFWMMGCAVLTGAALSTVLARANRRHALTWAFGAIYTTLPFAAFFWLREHSSYGVMLAVGMLVVVWTTDIAAYFAGRGFGGPLLSPLDSPNKTWTGAIGALICACLAGAAVARAIQAPVEAWLAASVVISIVAQSGDLLESKLKRKFGVKDTSGLIPGHGGVLDRLDALMAAAMLAGLLLWLFPSLSDLLAAPSPR